MVPYPGGVELAPLVERMEAFPKPHAWSIYLRRVLYPLPAADAKLLEEELHPLLMPLIEAGPTYPSPSQAPSP